MQGSIISKMTGKILDFFNEAIPNLGEVSSFVKRPDKAKVDAKTFAQVLVFGSLSNEQISLEEMNVLFKQRGITLSKSGLHQRFNNRSLLLMKQCYEVTLARFKMDPGANVFKLLEPFSSVELLDSSTIALPNNMQDMYRGCGGGGSEAGLKIQTLFNYTKGQIEEITFTSARESDQGFKGHLKEIKKDTLYLQDLGYFCIDSFLKIHQQEAYFLSRYFSHTTLLNEKGQKIDFLDILRNSGDFFSINAWLGKKESIPIRVIVQRLPAEEVEKRVRKLRENARKKGREPKAETLELAKWSIYITNIPAKLLKDEHIYLLYSLRWQIELFFKLCKQEASLEKISSSKRARVLCEIYAKLICVLIMLYICSPIRWQGEREISFAKAYCYLRQCAVVFLNALASAYRLNIFLKKCMSDLQDFSMKDIKRQKPATHQKVMSAGLKMPV